MFRVLMPNEQAVVRGEEMWDLPIESSYTWITDILGPNRQRREQDPWDRVNQLFTILSRKGPHTEDVPLLQISFIEDDSVLVTYKGQDQCHPLMLSRSDSYEVGILERFGNFTITLFQYKVGVVCHVPIDENLYESDRYRVYAGRHAEFKCMDPIFEAGLPDLDEALLSEEAKENPILKRKRDGSKKAQA